LNGHITTMEHDEEILNRVLGQVGRPVIYSGSPHAVSAQRPSLWTYFVDGKKYEIELKTYQVACGMRKLADALAKHEKRIQDFKRAQSDAMVRIEMRIKSRIIPLYKEEQYMSERSPVFQNELQGAISDASIFIKSEMVLKILEPTSNRLRTKLAEYEKLHIQLTIGNELDGINVILGNLSSGVPLQSVVNKILSNTEKFADATGLDSALADASSELESATNELSDNYQKSSVSPEKMITDMIAKMTLDQTLPKVPEIKVKTREDQLVSTMIQKN
jgi:hypothetical protein